MTNLKKQLSAALLRRDMRKARKANGLSTDLRAMIAEYRIMCPEYAARLERIIYPPSRLLKKQHMKQEEPK